MSPRKTMCSSSYARPDSRSVDDHCGERTVGTYIKWRTSRIMVCNSQLPETRSQCSCFQSLTSGHRRPARRSASFSVGAQALPAANVCVHAPVSMLHSLAIQSAELVNKKNDVGMTMRVINAPASTPDEAKSSVGLRTWPSRANLQLPSCKALARGFSSLASFVLLGCFSSPM